MTRPDPSVPIRGASEPTIIAGIGCRRGTSAAEIIGLVEDGLVAAGLTAQSLLAIATLERKAGEPGLLAAAVALGVPLRVLAADQLAVSGVVAQSKILSLVGVPSVAEAVARRAGPLVLGKRRSAQATCALAAVAPGFVLSEFGQLVPLPAMAAMAASRSLTSNAGP